MRREPRRHAPLRTGALLVAFATTWLPTAATAQPTRELSERATHKGCHSALSFVDVPNEEVQALVPHYKVKSDNGRTTNLNIDPYACENVVTAEGEETGAVRVAIVMAEVCQSNGAARDGTDCRLKADLYLLFLVTDNQAYAEWLRAGTGLDVEYVPGMVYEFDRPDVGDVPLAPYSFAVPFPAPAPFQLAGDVSAESAAFVPIFETEWFFQDTDNRQRTVSVGYEDHVDYFAPAHDMTITAQEGSKMARIMGTSQATPTLTVPHWIDEFVMVKTVTRT